MSLTILTSTVRFADYGAIYLTESQMKAAFLELRVSIQKIQSPVSVSFQRNPPQSVFGYLTTCYQECVYDEIQCRYDYQSLYRSFDNYQLLAQLECIYYRAIAANQNSIASTNTTQGPYSILQVEGLTTAIRRPVDSFRFKAINPAIFDMILFWSYDDTDYSNCGLNILDLPSILPPSRNAPAYDSARNSNPNAASETITSGLPTDTAKTKVPDNAPSSDFSSRNDFPVAPPPGQIGTWAYKLVLRRKSNNELLTYNQTQYADSFPYPAISTSGGEIRLVYRQEGNTYSSFFGTTADFDVQSFDLLSFTP